MSVPLDVIISTLVSLGTELLDLNTEQLKNSRAVNPNIIFLKTLNI